MQLMRYYDVVMTLALVHDNFITTSVNGISISNFLSLTDLVMTLARTNANVITTLVNEISISSC